MGKINFIPSSEGKVVGNHAALEQPVNPTDLADYLEATNRPAFNAPSITNEVFVETTGSDTTGDGLSVGTAFATISKAIQMIGTLNDSTVTIRLGSGTFTMPDLLSEQNWTTFLGTTSVSESRTISTVDTLSDADGIALTIDGGPFVTDALRGQMVQWTSGAANNDFGWIYRNTGNQIFVTNEDPDNLPAIVATDTLDFITLDTTLEYTGTPVIQNSVQLNVQKCNVADDAPNGRVLFVLSTDKIEYRYCNWTMARPQVGGYGRAHFWCNYIGTKGATNRGCLAGVNGAFIQLERGTVIDCGLNTSAANKRFIQFAAGANVSYKGQLVVRQIDDAKGVQCDGVEWLATGGLGAHDTWRFETEGVTASCIAGFVVNTTGEGIGGTAQLPNLQGEVTSAYCISAQDGAYIKLGNTSSCTTSSVLNAVSADNGVSAISEASDGTIIFGGDPVSSGFFQGTPGTLTGLYAQTVQSATITTAPEQSIVGTGVGVLSVPGNIFAVGDSFHAKIGGVINATGGGGRSEIILRIKTGATILASTGIFELDTATNQGWEAEIDFTVATIGAVGSICTNGNFAFVKDNDRKVSGYVFQDVQPINTTISNTLDITIEWNVLNVGDDIYSANFVLYKTFTA